MFWGPSKKLPSLKLTLLFQGSIFRRELLVSGRVRRNLSTNQALLFFIFPLKIPERCTTVVFNLGDEWPGWNFHRKHPECVTRNHWVIEGCLTFDYILSLASWITNLYLQLSHVVHMLSCLASALGGRNKEKKLQKWIHQLSQNRVLEIPTASER